MKEEKSALRAFDITNLTNLIIPKKRLNELISINDQSAYYGLTLSEKEIVELVRERNAALKNTERIEFGFNTLECVINNFYKSPYINQFEYAEIINEIQILFYYIKNEVDEIFSDEELILLMSELFDKIYNGSLELLKGKGVEFILEAARDRKAAMAEEGEKWK